MVLAAPDLSIPRSQLDGTRIRLRSYTAHDEQSLLDAVRQSLPELSRWMPWARADYNRIDAREWAITRADQFRRGIAYSFVVEERRGGGFLGGVGLDAIDWLNRRANLAYWVRTSDSCKGITTEAARLVARFGLEDLGLIRVEIVAAAENRASQRVAEKLGATREAMLRDRLLVNGRVHDAVMYSLTQDDLPKL